jgi:hypothetical protein
LQGDIKVRCRELLIQVCDVIVLLRAGNNDLRRITRQTRVIAVDMPNVKDYQINPSAII